MHSACTSWAVSGVSACNRIDNKHSWKKIIGFWTLCNHNISLQELSWPEFTLCKETLLVMILHLSYSNLIFYRKGSEASFILVLFRTLNSQSTWDSSLFKTLQAFMNFLGCNVTVHILSIWLISVQFHIKFLKHFFCFDIKQLLLLDPLFSQLCYADCSIALIKGIGLF